MPVIIFCNDVNILHEQLPEALMFVGKEVGELNSILKLCRTSDNIIILTTSVDSKGVDFVFAVP